jgi:glycosyltransferase involved in cell wall biosynthesis
VAAAERLRADLARREELGRRARAYAETTFDLDRITDRFEEILRKAAR